MTVQSAHMELSVRISTGGKHLSKVKNIITTWGKIVGKMSVATPDPLHTLDEYSSLPMAEQASLKNVGYFVGGHCDNGNRRLDSIQERWLVTLDVDEANAGHLADLTWGNTDLAPFEFFSYSTRKHTPESPRVRIVLPLSKPCSAEAYHALSRILSHKFDASMASVDPVSFRSTQLMYWPSVCKNAEFFTFHNPGDLVDPDKVLEAFGDWRDYTKLPRSERDESSYNPLGKKPEDPETKTGLVGAFCRAYDVTAAIDEFLSDVYIDPKEEHGGSTRYTYAGGTTFHGAVVYDQGKFLYSNHMHDPAAGHSQNAFDLVRLHLYGELDAKARPDTSPLKLPSVKAMADRLLMDQNVVAELRESNYDVNAMFGMIDDDGVFDDVVDTVEPEDDGLGTYERKDESLTWLEALDVSSDGVIKPTLPNIVAILRNDPRVSGCCRLNRFTGSVVYHRAADTRQLPISGPRLVDAVNGDLWTDSHTLVVRYLLETPRGEGRPGYGMRIPKADLEGAIDLAASQESFHPVIEYLEPLKWDGVKRIDRFFIDYLGTEDNAYTRSTARLTLVAAVTRVFEPGHKWDFVPIIEGAQGKRKSTLIETIGHLWSGHLKSALDDTNKAVESMQGAWILEIPELSQFKRADVEALKDFFSSRSEKVRLAYERRVRLYLRQCVFLGSSNNSDYLRDQTGNRRFWPIISTVEEINIALLVANRDQLWAEALQIYREMRAAQPYGDLPLYLSDKGAEKIAKIVQESRRIESEEESLARDIENWLKLPCHPDDAAGKRNQDFGTFDEDSPRLVPRTRTCNKEIWEKALGRDVSELLGRNGHMQQKITRAMGYIKGWSKPGGTKKHGDYRDQRVYELIEDDEL